MEEIRFRVYSEHSGNMTEWKTLRGLHVGTVFVRGPGYHLMQFIGLKDRRGREIYEGDVLKAGAAMGGDAFLIRRCLPLTRTTWSYIERVGFWHGKKYHALGEKRTQVDISYDDILSFPEECEIIGNIYENPELLRQADH